MTAPSKVTNVLIHNYKFTMNYIYIAFLALLLSTHPTISLAKRFDTDGLNVDVYWKFKRNQLRVWGDIRGEKYCKYVDLRIMFKNSKTKKHTYVYADTSEVKNGFKTIFSTRSKKMNSHNKNYWSARQIHLNCIKE